MRDFLRAEESETLAAMAPGPMAMVLVPLAMAPEPDA